MSYACKILKDSTYTRVNESYRITTFEVTFPRFILAEVNTHRMLSRNSASSRAIPTEKLIQRVTDAPFVPEFNVRVTGMGVGDALHPSEQAEARGHWLNVRDAAVDAAGWLTHTDKSRVNRLLEPFMWHTAIITATDWSNFFALRTDANAQPEFRTIASMMLDAYLASTPSLLTSSEWHLPLVDDVEIWTEANTYPEPWIDWEMWRKVCVGRCARVSYLTHDGVRDLQADIALHDRLMTNGHLSPHEHAARPFARGEWDAIDTVKTGLNMVRWSYDTKEAVNIAQQLSQQVEYCGNLRGWHSARYDVPNQADYSLQQGASN